jgi:hypothetical protein
MTTAPRDVAFDAAYDALTYYSTLAQVRAAAAGHIADVLSSYHPYAAVAVAAETWPAHLQPMGMDALAAVVQAAHESMKESR